MRKKLLDLKIELVKRGLSQAALARAIGRSPSQVSRMMRGISRPRLRDKRQIAEFLGLKLSQLFGTHRRRSVQESPNTAAAQPRCDHNSIPEDQDDNNRSSTGDHNPP